MFVSKLLTLHSQIRIFHWQTKSYAEHQALGGLYDSLDDLIDTFAEIYFGKYGRIRTDTTFDISLANYEPATPLEVVDNAILYLTVELPKGLQSSDTDLLNIRDEMLGLLNQTKYLLTLH
jgi:hypothetical protein